MTAIERTTYDDPVPALHDVVEPDVRESTIRRSSTSSTRPRPCQWLSARGDRRLGTRHDHDVCQVEAPATCTYLPPWELVENGIVK